MDTWQTAWKKIKKHLQRARSVLPVSDEFLVAKAKKASTNIHLTEDGYWSFYRFIEVNELALAWEELKWAYEKRSRDSWRGDWRQPRDEATFWKEMARAAWEMTNNACT